MIISILVSFTDPHIRELYRDKIVNLDSIFLSVRDGNKVLKESLIKEISASFGFKPVLISISALGRDRIILNQSCLDPREFGVLKRQLNEQNSRAEPCIQYMKNGIPFMVRRPIQTENWAPPNPKKNLQTRDEEKATSYYRETNRKKDAKDQENFDSLDVYIQRVSQLTSCQQTLITKLSRGGLDNAEILEILDHYQANRLGSAKLTLFLKEKLKKLSA
jgi:hypothetical protein